jgi:acyl dehydratase
MTQPEVLFDDIEVGYEIPQLVKDPITETQLVMYAGASGDFNPIHTVHAFGEKAGFGGVIGHGMLSMGFAGQFMTNWAGVHAVKKLAVQFRAVTKPKDVVTVSGKVVKKYTNEAQKLVDCEFLALNQKGDKIIVGTATAELS